VVFLLAGERGSLVPVERRAASSTLGAVLDELAAGPSAAEAARGLRSAIPDEQFLADVTLGGGTATVGLTDDFSSLGGQDQLLAIGQLVLSLTAQPGVGRVAFTLDGERVEVPRGDGSLTSGSVSRDAYADLVDDGMPAARPAGPAVGTSPVDSTVPTVR
jgi:spore germination protein GerM